jgi:hypothetical protein
MLEPAIRSSIQFVRLSRRNSIRQCRERLGETYNIHHSGGTDYSVFRETQSRDGTIEAPVVLVVGFRLRFIGSNRFLHWCFQRICIVSSPIWSGFRGFWVKLWMVDRRAKNYLGIYEWAGEGNSRFYAEWLSELLRHLSTRGSVWYELHRNEELAGYLKAHKASPKESACLQESLPNTVQSS